MNASLLVPLLLSVCQVPVAATTPAAPEVTARTDQGETQVRVYDLEPLAPRVVEMEVRDLVLPVLGPWSDEDFDAPEVQVDDEIPAQLLRMLFAPELEYEGNAIEYLGEGRFAVTAPAGLHERIARALPRLGAALNATVDLELTLVQLDGLPDGPWGVVPEAQAAALIEQAAPELVVRRRLSVSSARPVTSVQGRWVDLLADYECEVAQGAYTFDPQILRAWLGTRLTLRAAPGAGGTLLALSVRRTSGVGQPSERTLTRVARMSNERDMRVDEIDLVHQRLPILDHALGLNTFLPDGQALVLAASQGRVDAHELLVVRRVGGGLPRTTRLDAGSGGGGLVLVDSSGWAPPYATLLAEELGFARAPRDPLRSGANVYVFLVGPRERGLPVEDLLYSFPGVSEDHTFYMEHLEGWLAVAPSEDGSLPDVEAAVGRFAADSRLVQVALTLRSPSLDAPIARLTLPLRAGLRSSAVLGVEDTYVGDAEVEIAQDSSVEDPILCSLFDGLVLELSPRFDLDGSLVLGLRGQASARDGDPRRVASSAGSVGEVEVASQRFLVISEELRFPVGGGASRATIGDLSGGLSLEVEARF